MIRLTSKELIETPKYKFADKLIKKAIEEYSPNIYYDYLGYKVYIREYRMPSVFIENPTLDNIIVSLTATNIAKHVSSDLMDKIGYTKFIEIPITKIKEWKD